MVIYLFIHLYVYVFINYIAISPCKSFDKYRVCMYSHISVGCREKPIYDKKLYCTGIGKALYILPHLPRRRMNAGNYRQIPWSCGGIQMTMASAFGCRV